jgi:hypothetical protein
MSDKIAILAAAWPRYTLGHTGMGTGAEAARAAFIALP